MEGGIGREEGEGREGGREEGGEGGREEGQDNSVTGPQHSWKKLYLNFV